MILFARYNITQQKPPLTLPHRLAIRFDLNELGHISTLKQRKEAFLGRGKAALAYIVNPMVFAKAQSCMVGRLEV